MIYLDHNATSPLRPEAKLALAAAVGAIGNPSSVHERGRLARQEIEKARADVAELAGAKAEDVIFTSGGTEANALALWGAVYGALEAEQRITRIFVSAVEHSSIIANAHAIADRMAGVRVAEIPVTPEGIIDIEALRVMLREGKGRTLVSVMAANNETGVVQPIDEVAKHACASGALLLVDAVQAAGKIPIACDADYLTLSGHKLGALQGAGALIVRDGASFAPLIVGGGQERSRRGGTENVTGIATFGAVASTAAKLGDVARQKALRDRFETELMQRWPDAVVFGARAQRLCNTSNFAIPGVTAETALIALDLGGICASSGAACSSGKVRPSHVPKAMGVSDDEAVGALRVSFGWNSQDSDVDGAITALERHVARVRSRAAA